VGEEDFSIHVKAEEGKRVGVTRTNQLSVDAIVAAERKAREMERHQPENPHFPGLVGPGEFAPTDTYCENTLNFGPAKRTEVLAEVFAEAAKHKFEVAGSFSISEGEVALANTAGLEVYQPITGTELGLVIASGEGMSRADAFSCDVERIDFGKLADRAISRCILDKDQAELPPGEYTVILEPACLTGVMMWLSFVAFGSEAFLSGSSFLSGALGSAPWGRTSPSTTLPGSRRHKGSRSTSRAYRNGRWSSSSGESIEEWCLTGRAPPRPAPSPPDTPARPGPHGAPSPGTVSRPRGLVLGGDDRAL
jgi:predicted Zn-dependent protease